MEKDSLGITRIILYFSGSTYLTAMLAALSSILVSLLIIMLLLATSHAAFSYIHQQLSQMQPFIHALGQLPINDIIILFVSSFLGSVVSVLARLRDFLSGATFQPLIIYISVITKPFLSVVFALFVYAVMKADLISLPGVDLAEPSAPYVVWVIGFLCGFSERLAQDLIVGVEHRFGGAEAQVEKHDGPSLDKRS